MKTWKLKQKKKKIQKKSLFPVLSMDQMEVMLLQFTCSMYTNIQSTMASLQ
jgi:hypothetical protein